MPKTFSETFLQIQCPKKTSKQYSCDIINVEKKLYNMYVLHSIFNHMIPE